MVAIRTKLGRGAAVLSAVGALGLAGSVVQATAAEAATHSGNWSITAVLDGTTNTGSIVTNSTHKISTCVSVTKTAGIGGEWSYELIWYDGGKNKVLYHSGDHEGNARVCSPVEKPGGNDKVYDHIILFNAGADLEVQAFGTYSLDTY